MCYFAEAGRPRYSLVWYLWSKTVYNEGKLQFVA
jgi:hypothetical protein